MAQEKYETQSIIESIAVTATKITNTANTIAITATLNTINTVKALCNTITQNTNSKSDVKISKNGITITRENKENEITITLGKYGEKEKTALTYHKKAADTETKTLIAAGYYRSQKRITSSK